MNQTNAETPIRFFVCQLGNASDADYWLRRAESARQQARNTNSPDFKALLEKQADGYTANAIAAAS